MISQKYLKSVLHYNPDTGVFTWTSCRGRIRIGSVAGTKRTEQGYVVIRIDNQGYYAHQLAVLYMTGYLPIYPKDEVDHLNTIKHDNRWSNLQLTNCTGNSNNLMTRMNKSKAGRGNANSVGKNLGNSYALGTHSNAGRVLSETHKLRISESLRGKRK
jgi:hypothetical protein